MHVPFADRVQYHPIAYKYANRVEAARWQETILTAGLLTPSDL